MQFKAKNWKAPFPPKVCVGDIYPAMGGKGTYAFVVAAVNENGMVHCFGINKEGNIVTTTSYGRHTFGRREKIGFCEDLANLTLEIDMFGVSDYGKN